MVWMKSRCTPTRCAPKSSTAATEKQRMPLMPTAARRWLIRSVSGCPIRHASRKSAAHATASAISAIRTVCRAARSETSQNANSWCRAAATRQPAPTISSANQIRSAARPTDLLPHASWALPGSTSVIAIRASARRNRTFAARSAVLRLTLVYSAAIRDSLLRGRSGVRTMCPWQYHQSQESQPCRTRRWAAVQPPNACASMAATSSSVGGRSTYTSRIASWSGLGRSGPRHASCMPSRSAVRREAVLCSSR